MKRKILILLFLLMTLNFAAVGCGGGQPTVDVKATVEAQVQATLAVMSSTVEPTSLAATLTPVAAVEEPPTSPTPAPTDTSTPTPTIAPTNTPTPMSVPPTAMPIPGFETVLPTAAELCEASFLEDRQGLEENTLPGSVLVMENRTYYERGWERMHLNESYLTIARWPDELAALVCIEMGRAHAGSYTDGAAAYKLNWDVRIVNWPEGEVIASMNFPGGDPPSTKSGSGPGYGSEPYRDLKKWLHSLSPPPEEQVMVLTSDTDSVKMVSTVAFSPDGRLLASGGEDRTVRLWEVETGEEIATLPQDRHWVSSVAFSPDGKLLAWDSNGKAVTLWEIETGKPVATLAGHTESVKSIAFSSDGKLLASCSWDNTVRLWELETGKQVAILTGPKWISSVAFSPDGKLLASGNRDDTVTMWEVETGEMVAVLTGHMHKVSSVAFSPDGKWLASGSLDITGKKSVILWEVETGRKAAILGHTDKVYSVAFSPDGKLLASGSNKKLILWEVETGEMVATLIGHTDNINSVTFSADGELLASGSEDGTVILWKVPD